MTKKLCIIGLLTMIALSNHCVFAQLSTSVLFSDNMVLQRNREVPVWGWNTPGAEVEVTIRGKTVKTTTDADGQWKARLPALQAGGPYQMTISSGEDKIVIRNILYGDVWVCSGQSNMAWQVKNSNDAKREIANAKDGQIRHFKVPLKGSIQLEERLPGGQWEVTSPQTVGEFTAVGYFFAKQLRKSTDVPIGLINSSWGGSSIEAWMSAELHVESGTGDALARMEREFAAKRLADRKKLEAVIGNLPTKDEGIANGLAIWAGRSFDDNSWKNMALPKLWEDAGLPNLDGVVWFRKSVNLPDELAQENWELGLAKIDDSDRVWINGQEVGESKNAYNEIRRYPVDGTFLRPGENVITVRVEDTGGGGGIYGEPGQLYLKSPNFSAPLAGQWKYKVGEYRAEEARVNQSPTMLYNQMIYPMLGYGITGVIWYQGESNAGGERAFTYREQFPAMINDWRKKWGQQDFPFLFVQLANWRAAKDQPTESSWAMLRESQSKTLEVSPNSGQAVIIDIGEADDIHPRNKQDVGYRLALAARKIAYGEDIVYSGPSYQSHTVEDNKIYLTFDHIGSGLRAKDKYGYLKGFAIAGSDQKFRWAKAAIEGDRIVVWSEEVPNPVAVRYAWADNPDDANLYNEEGLPASPFRTDDW